MSAEFFLDTNILIYDLEGKDPLKQPIATGLIQEAMREGTGLISFQVVQECLNVAIQKARQPLTRVEAERYLEIVLSPLCLIYPSEPLYRKALSLKERWRYSFYDSLIIAAALTAGCDTLYTEDMQHGQVIEDLKIINPFSAE
jgi:predicted nucleic acid-binding protein